MAIGSGAIGQFAIGQGSTSFYSLSTTGFAPGSPALDTPALSHRYAATAQDLNTSAPVLDTPSLIYPLTASALTTSSPALDTPSLSHAYSLSANALAPSSPVLDTPSLTHRYAVTAIDLATGSPSLDSPGIGFMTANDLTTGSPELDTPNMAPCVLGIDMYVRLLLHGDGSNASTTIVDSGPLGKTMTAHDNAQLTTSSPKFGTASMTFDGTNDYIDTPDSADFTLGSNNFTIDFWFNTLGNGNGTTRRVSGHASSTGAGSDSAWHFTLGASNTIGFNLSNGGFVAVLGTTAITTAGWHHAAGVRTGNTLKFFLDGVQEGGDVTFSSAVIDTAGSLALGRRGDQNAQYFPGQIDEFRVSVGIARWTSNFTPATTAYGYCCAAADLAPSSPDLGTPTLSHAYSATASGLTTGSPALDTPTLSHAYAVTATDLTTSSPVLDSPSLTHAYAPTAQDLNTSAPVLDSPALLYVLAASDLATGSPVLDAPSLTHAYAVTANNLTTGSPVLDTPSLSHAYAPVAVDLETGSPVLGTPAFFSTGDLLAVDLEPDSPVLDAPAASIGYLLVANGLTTGSPVLDTPTLSHHYAVTAIDLTTASPDLGAPGVVFGGFLALDFDTQSPALDTPTLSHRYTVLAVDLIPASPDLDAPGCIVHADLVAEDLETDSPELDTPEYGVFFGLVAEDLVVASPDLDEPACTFVVMPRAEDLINLGDILLDPIYDSMISNPARVYPSTSGMPFVDLRCINHTAGIVVQINIDVQTIRPAVDIRVREIELYGVHREDLTDGQVMLWPDTPQQELWHIEDVLPRPGIWGEESGELRLWLQDRIS